VALLVRLILLARYYCINSDGVIYLRAAEGFFFGDLNTALGSVYPPGYPFLVAALYPLVGSWELSGQAVSLVCGVLLLLPLYGLFRRVFDERVAWLAAFLAAVSPFLALYSVHVRSESLYLLLATSAVYVLVMAIRERRTAKFFSSGLLAGYAFLVRPEAIALVALIPAFLAVLWIGGGAFDLAFIGRAAAGLCTGFFLFALPYIVYLSIDTGQIGALSRKAGITLAINLQESGLLDADEATAEKDIDHVGFVEYIRAHPLRYAKKAISDLLPAVGVYFEALHYSYVPFLLLGLLLARREGFHDKERLLVLGLVGFYVFSFALIYVKRRYALQAVPLSLAWVAYGMWWTWEWLQVRLKPSNARLAALTIALLFCAGTLPKTLKAVSKEKAYVREAGLYLKDISKRGALKIAALDYRIGFYAQAETLLLSGMSRPELAAKLRANDADYLAAELKALSRAFPDLPADPQRYGLALEKTFVGSRQDQLLLYRVL
jgi:4-amino-4-deoxy-L-arabinose transferase-like glycosyltransferase